MIGFIIAAVLVAEILLIIFLPAVGWSILGLLALLILLVLFVPVGADVGYVGGEFSLAARANGFSFRLYPKKPKEEGKPEKEKPKNPKKPKKEKKPKAPDDVNKPSKKLDLTMDEIFELLRKAIKGLGKFGKLCVHEFMLHYVAAGKDPYATAMSYNYVNAALSSLAPVCAQSFKVKGDVDVWTDVDFTAEKMQLDARISITLRLVQVLHVGFAVLFGALGVLLKNRLRLFREKQAEKKANKNLPPVNNTEEKTETNTNIKTEERMDSNG